MKINTGSVVIPLRKPLALFGITFLAMLFGVSTMVHAETNKRSYRPDRKSAAKSAKLINDWKAARIAADIWGDVPSQGNAVAKEFSIMEPSAPTADPLIWAYNFTQDRLVSFQSSTPGTIINNVAITGLGANEFLEFIDFRPADGFLYAVTKDEFLPTSRVVRINTTTGVATPVGSTFATAAGLFYGGDFNPVVDLIREVSSDEVNRRISPAGGLTATDTPLAYAAGDVNAGLNPNVVHVAYSNNTAGATSTTLYGIDSATDTLVRIGSIGGTPSSPNAGQITTIGPLGVNAASFGGFDIQQGTDIAFASLTVSSLPTLYRINLATGQATLIGTIGVGTDRIDGLALQPSNTAASANLSITKTTTATTYTPGGTVPYTITVTNAGPDPVVGATVTDTLGNQFSGGTFTCTGTGGATCPANGTGNINSQVNIPVNGSVTFQLTATTAANASGPLTNSATVAAPAGVTDATTNNNAATVTTAQSASSADLAITKTTTATSYNSGQAIPYTITVTNLGPNAVNGATVTDTLGNQFSGGTFTCTGTGGATCPANGTGNISSQVNLPVNGTVTFQYSATTTPGSVGPITNTATVAVPAGSTDPNGANNTASVTTQQAPVNLSITKTTTATTYSAGQTVPYTITVTNPGPGAVMGATVTDTLGSQFSGGTFTCTGTGGATCPASGTGNINAPVNLPANSSVTFQLVATVAGSTTGPLTNNASVATPTGIVDSNTNNNSNGVTIQQAAVDLSITKTTTITNYTPNQTVPYTITVTNNGPGAVVGARVTDTLSSQFAGGRFSCTTTGGATCPAGTTNGNINTLVNIPSGGTVTFTYITTVAPNSTGPLVNSASVAAPTGQTETNANNNTATSSVQLQPTAAGVSISGRVVGADGRALRGATVTLIDSRGNAVTVVTSSLGYYSFEEVAAGETYVVGVSSKRYRFASRAVQVNDSVADVDFVGVE